MASPSEAAAAIGRGPEIARRLAGVGLEAPVPIASRSLTGRGVVVSTWIEGTPGMARLGSPEGAEAVGRALGAGWHALAAVDPSGLGLDDLWARPDDLEGAARRWLELARADLGVSAAARVVARIGGLAVLLRDRPARFVHGDLVPANVLLREGRGAALLDFEASRVGDALLDAAWFSWIVRYHHPEIHARAWAAFAEAAGLRASEAAVRQLLATLPVVRILEILEDRDLSPGARARWLDHLHAIVSDLGLPDSTEG
jgi:aminoglycoside phosphotransferase (APT) family kinase protein